MELGRISMFSKILNIFNTAAKKLEEYQKELELANEREEKKKLAERAELIENTFETKNMRYKKQAFEVVMQQTDIPADKQNEIFSAWEPFGNDKKLCQQLMEILPSDTWKWYEFDKWKEIFTKDGLFPYMWKKYPEMLMNNIEEIPLINNFNSHSDVYMKVGEIKALLEKLEIKIPAKAKRNDLLLLLEDNVTYKIIKEKLPKLYESKRVNFIRKQYIGKCYIFIHYLDNMYAKHRNWDSSDFFLKHYKRTLSVVSGCPVEKKYATKARKQPITFENSPPFFPGDRTSITYDKR